MSSGPASTGPRPAASASRPSAASGAPSRSSRHSQPSASSAVVIPWSGVASGELK